MYRSWVFSAKDAETVARQLEAHLNEFAEEVVSVSYAVQDRHHVLAVYRAIESAQGDAAGVAVSVAEQIIDEVQI